MKQILSITIAMFLGFALTFCSSEQKKETPEPTVDQTQNTNTNTQTNKPSVDDYYRSRQSVSK